VARGHYRILLGMAAGVGKTYRMLQEGRQAKEAGRDVVIGYLEPHDRPETIALADGLEVVPRLRAAHGGLELEEMDTDAVIKRSPELALVDELAHTNAPRRAQREALPGHRGDPRCRDRRHLDRQCPAPREPQRRDLRADRRARPRDLPRPHPRRSRPGRARRPHTREELQERLSAGKVYPRERAEVALQNFFRYENLAKLRELVLREVAEDVEARRHVDALEPLSQQAIHERVLALVEPQPKSQRILRRAWRSAQRLGADIDALWMHPDGREATPEEQTQLAALRRVASLLGVHFLEERGDDLVETVRRVAGERGTTYIFIGTPDESRRREIFGGSLLSRMVREIPGIDIRVIADRGLKEEGRNDGAAQDSLSARESRARACSSLLSPPSTTMATTGIAARARRVHARTSRADRARRCDTHRPR
jgi:two-component system, OmpR family, sensor histidine kinase KdpD